MGHSPGRNYDKDLKPMGSFQAYGCSHNGVAATDPAAPKYHQRSTGRQYPFGCRHGWDRPRVWDPQRKVYDNNLKGGNGTEPYPVTMSGRNFLFILKPCQGKKLIAQSTNSLPQFLFFFICSLPPMTNITIREALC